MCNKHHSCGPTVASRTAKDLPLFFIIMRFNTKIALLVVIVLGIFTFIAMWSFCIDRNDNWFKSIEIDCIINNDYAINCLKENDEIFLPFSFLKKYYEVYGKMVNVDGAERFEWSHNSYNKIYFPKQDYDPKGAFMYFENYNVEMRERVKYISGVDGVPISTQWSSQGYYYATQIAQFGLSHYSKNLSESEPKRKIIENAKEIRANWEISETQSYLERSYDNSVNYHSMNFRTGDREILLKIDSYSELVASVHLKLSTNSSLTFVLHHREKNDVYSLHYISTDVTLTAVENNVYHGIGNGGVWQRITRDLVVDLDKGLNLKIKQKRIPRSKLKLSAILLYGHGSIANLTLSTSEHMELFYNAAEWFVKHQDTNGGWPIPVRRHLANGFSDLEPGWYSAMGQGQALSVLSRAYHHSGGDLRYLKSAISGLKPFIVSSIDGGVRTFFMDKFVWYEEYPTTPPSFVLNGFIYSLLGLYDLMKIAPKHTYGAEMARKLFDDGVISLRNMTTLFDMGSGTSYDLRHFTLKTAPNLARWDYHATHVNQLLVFGRILNEPLFTHTAQRWIGYMNGKRAPHN